MDLKEKIGQRLMIGIEGNTIDAKTKKHLLELQPGFIILFSRNISSPTQVRTLITHLHELLPSPPLIAIDQEGGRVIRFTKGVTVFPGNMALGAAGSPLLAYHQGLISAFQLKKMGITINLAPVVDVITSHYNPGITIRSFGDDPGKVSALATALIRGTQRMGVAAVAKHFPGKGAAEVDAHHDLPTIALSRKSFTKTHLYPFRKAIENGVRGIMSTHIHCPTLDSKGHHPATFSKNIIHDCLRTSLAYHGVIFSDDLEMGAIGKYHRIEDACLRATEAGHDVLLICSNYQWQKRAFRALRDAYTHSLLSHAALDASIEKIQNLQNFCSKQVPSLRTKTLPNPDTLTRQIAQRSITIISDAHHLLPLTSDKTKDILLLFPDLSTLPTLEEGYKPTAHHFLIRECKRYFSGTLSFHFFSLNPDHKEIERISALLNHHQLCILCISNAQGHGGQKVLIKKLQKGNQDTIYVLLDNPFDREWLSPKDTCITTYGFRRIQLSSLIKVIFGKAHAPGNLPFRQVKWLR